MKPVQIFLIFFTTLVLLLALSFVFPSQGIKGIGGVTLRFPQLQDLLEQSSDSSIADITHILEQSEVLVGEAKDTFIGPPPVKLIANTDSIAPDSILKPVYPVYNRESLRKLVFPITYPENDSRALYPFFKKLEHITSSGQSLRILHYGDSQIEGDRITSYIREKLQAEFGGYGPGLFSPHMLVQHTLSIKQSTSSNWHRYGIRDINNGIIDHDRLGIMMNFGRYLFPDSTLSDESQPHEAEIIVEPSGLGYKRVNYFDQIKMFYGFNRAPVAFELKTPDHTIHLDTLTENQSLNVLTIDNGSMLNHMIIRLKGSDSPDVYGISLESNSGVLVDNIPLRGSSGLDFSRSDTLILKEMLNELNVGLLILEFGVNIAPNIVKGYKWYESRFYNQLVLMKSLRPEMSVLVMGISDLSRKVDDSYQSYPNIGAIRDAQRNAAFRAGCSFWDTFEAMGGENSMPGWVFADPPLARPDFVHFSNLGSKVIGEMFHNALMEEYNKYLLEQTK